MFYPKDLLRHPGVYCHNTPDGIPHVHEHFTAAPHPGHRVIAVCGKGGVGKSALCALMTYALVHRPDTGKLLVIDADPALGLALALGVTPSHTIASVRDELLAAARSQSTQAEQEIAHRLDYLVFRSMVETDDYAFVAMGRSHELGCYCSVNDLLRDSLELLVRDFDTTLIDGEAGLEQINRQVVASLDSLVCVSDGSARGQRTVETIWDMTAETELVDHDDVFLVLNRQEPNVAPAPLRDDVQPHLLGIVPANEGLAAYDRDGRPLTTLPQDNDAVRAVQHLVDHLFMHSA
ncbi:AAA family ATPase [bacterium]|nr:AAA family ATPase [bacterium]